MDTSLEDMPLLSEGDSGGESFGLGLDNSALGLTGSSALTLDFAGETPLQGSPLNLDYSDGLAFDGAITDLSNFPESLSYDQSLSGISDGMPSWDLTSDHSLNGAGSALSMYHKTNPVSSDISGVSSLFSAIDKFGTAFGTLLASPTGRATPGQVPANANPNYKPRTSITGTHAAILVGVALLLVGAIALGGSK